jgi:hypothetical protein
LLTNEFKLRADGTQMMSLSSVNKINSKVDNRDFNVGDWVERPLNHHEQRVQRVHFLIEVIGPARVACDVEKFILEPKPGEVTISQDDV